MGLTLERKVGQSIMVGDAVKITVLEIKGGGRIRISVDAPRELDVHRLEVYERIQAERGLSPKSNGTQPTKSPVRESGADSGS